MPVQVPWLHLFIHCFNHAKSEVEPHKDNAYNQHWFPRDFRYHETPMDAFGSVNYWSDWNFVQFLKQAD